MTQDTILWKGIDTSNVSSVKSVMQQQATYLGRITNNVVEAKLRTTLNVDETANGFIDKPTVTYCFDIVAPLLNYSSFTLFCVEQIVGVEYPIKFYSNYWEKKECECKDITGFTKCLEEILSSEQVVHIINSIIATSK